jgi:DNA-binding CsgD family transcriptional regulator
MRRGAWPLVGRDEELAFVAATFDEPESRGLVLAGPSGVGKTRLLDEALTLAHARGWAVERVAATAAGQAIPFSPFTHILTPEDHPSSDRLALLLRVTAELSARAAGRRLIVAVDDAHWLNDLSAALVHQIATQGTAFVLATIRTGTPSPDPVTALWKDDLARRVDVQALSVRDMEALVAVGAGGPCDTATVRELARMSGGNVLFLHELVTGGIEAGLFVEDGGVKRWRGSPAQAGNLVELVEARMGRLEPDERTVLEVVAVSGGLEATLLDRFGPPSVAEVLERKGLVDVVRDGRRTLIRMVHPLYGEVLQIGTPALRAQAIRRQLADTVSEIGSGRGDDALRVATWRLDAGGTMSGDAWTSAARIASARFDFALTERLARTAVEAGGGYAASYLLGCALLGQGRGDEAETVFEPIAAEAATDADRARLALTRAENLLYVLGRSSDAESVLRRTLDEVSEPRWRDELANASSTSRTVRVPDGPRADRPNDRASSPLGGVPRLSPAAGRALTKRTLIATVLGWAAQGDTDPALAAIAAWLEHPGREDTGREGFEQFLSLRVAHWAALRSAGRYDAAETLALEHYQRMLPQGAFAQGVAGYLVGATAMLQGRPRTALPWLHEAVGLLREHGRSYFLSEALGVLVQVSAVIGDVPAATAAQAEAETLAETSPRSRYTLDMGRIWLLVARGELAEARALASASARESHQLGDQRLDQASMLYELARLGDAEHAAPHLHALAVGADGPLVATFAAYATALASHDGAALDRATSTFETMGDRLGAAEAAAAAAAAHHRAGQLPAARAARRRAARLLGRCEGAQTPALADLEAPRALTPREDEVARLAAAGRSDHQIAERLVLSVRTVESHLRHAYNKLGVSGRQELGLALSPDAAQSEQPGRETATRATNRAGAPVAPA